MKKLIKKIKDKVCKSDFTKNILIITGGTAFAQILNMLFVPIITRIYSPEEYGVLSVYIAVIGSLSFIGTFNYEMGITIAKNDNEATNVLGLSIITLIFSITVLIIALLVFGEFLLGIINATLISRYIIIIPIGLFFKGLYSIFVQWAYREKNFKSITKTKVSQSFSKNIAQLLFGILGKGELGLLLGQVMGEFSGIYALSYTPIMKKRLIKEIKKEDMRRLAKQYKDFPIYTTTRRFLGDIAISIPTILLKIIYNTNIVGFYGLANSIIQLPMNIIGTSISNVYFAECASLKNTHPEKILIISNKLLKKLIILGLFPLLIILFWGPFLFEVFFGHNWIDAGQYARVLSISVFTRFIFKPISNVFDIFEKQKFAFWINIIRIILVFMAFGVAKYWMLNSLWAVFLYSISMSIVYFIQYLGAQKIIKDAITSHF